MARKKEGVYFMRSFINYLLTITLFIAVIVTIAIFTVGSLTSPSSTRKMLDNIDYDVVINDFKNTDYGKEFYNYADSYGVSSDKVDSILKTEEAKDYVNKVLQQGIDAYLNNGSIEINDDTKEFINKANKKYELNLDDNEISELESYANEAINDNLNVVVGNTDTSDDTNSTTEGQFLIDIIKICRNDNLHTTLYIIIGVITLLLFISSFKKKNFLEYIGIVSITVAISTLLFNGLMALISDRMTSVANATIILKPVTDTFYMITFIGIILGIVLLIAQHFINKHVNKEVVPF
ncbi:MAG TPA: hypothetical protein IAB38_07170 [Candidatus Onthousia excrementipullorum]|uniref:Uncharacterized protein n=1 Tax=Candidatus Onthousia excrementipullorum TaxID=2840884 RepID=A0A9D1J3M0_9FIRM|nr:hypothetical protein [Candidatus Onthousia excrementipullorum]